MGLAVNPKAKPMSLRNFRDSEGGDWQVWDVLPHSRRQAERRRADRRRYPPPAYGGPERRVRADRRVRSPQLLTPGLESGWLCFETASEKRRLTPIPPQWESCSDEELERFCRNASRVGGRASLTRAS